jgi:replicative DNA helicase
VPSSWRTTSPSTCWLGLKREELYLDAHRKIYTAIVELVNEGSPIDTLSLANNLGAKVAGIGWRRGLPHRQLTDGVPRRASIDYYIDIIRKKALLRSMIHLSNGAIAWPSMLLPIRKSVISDAEEAFLSARRLHGKRAVTLKDRIRNTLEAIHAPMIRSVNSLATGSESALWMNR